VDRETDYLTVELQNESYARIILTVGNNLGWQQQLTR
jgi:hypothetical protein